MNGVHQIGGLEQDQLRKILANYKLTPATLAHKVSGGSWIASPHLQQISLRIAREIAKGSARIILSMPPRHGKSELVSVWTPVWLLEYIKRLNIILASYGQDLASGFSRRVRSIITDPANENLLTVRIGDLAKAEEFNTNFGGYFYAVGLGGAITGRGANVLLIDDYIKEIKEALSPAYRDYIWNWYVTTALTRLEPNGSVIIIATRWHSDDLIGRLLKHEGERWTYLELPAIALPGDMIGREVGTPLFVERYPLEKLHELKNTMGSIFFEALFQQRPVDDTMRMTNTSWLQAWEKDKPLPRYRKQIRVWDLAATEGGGDYLVGTLCGYDPKDDIFIIEDIVREQLGPGKIEGKVYETALRDGWDVEIGIEQEPGAAGKILVEHYITNILRDYRVKAVTVSKAKVVRAQPFLAAAEAMTVWYLAGESWNHAFINEFETFPTEINKSIHDDMIDTAAEAYSHLTGKRSISPVWGRGTNVESGPSVNRRSGTANSNAVKAANSKHAAISIGHRTRRASWGTR